jgi:hypothetical protein
MKPELIDGSGLRYLDRKAVWYGSFGGCNICGTTGDLLIPRQCRYWDADDGWRVGVLCSYCADDVRDRGPQPGDYAYPEKRGNAFFIDGLSVLGDLDGLYSELQDLGLTAQE